MNHTDPTNEYTRDQLIRAARSLTQALAGVTAALNCVTPADPPIRPRPQPYASRAAGRHRAGEATTLELFRRRT